MSQRPATAQRHGARPCAAATAVTGTLQPALSQAEDATSDGDSGDRPTGLCKSPLMDLVLLTHPSFADHDTGPHHPERPARLAAVLEGIRAAGVTLVEVEPPEADLDLLGLVHDTDYIEAICNFAWRAGTARPGHVRRSGILGGGGAGLQRPAAAP